MLEPLVVGGAISPSGTQSRDKEGWHTASMAPELPSLVLADAAAWWKWLEEHHARSAGVWLVLAKKGTTDRTRLTYGEALEGALSHGWIDGQTRALDDSVYARRFTPRAVRSTWSKRNVAIVERLTSDGRMHAAGLAEVERARADGRWEKAYEGSRSIEVPADLAAALQARPDAKAMFEALTRQNRFAMLYRIDAAKRSQTRTRRIDQYVEMLANGETIYPQGRRLRE
jgi:uncharacterized protein YdeI (YjbR/CyaY-like superfamily)